MTTLDRLVRLFVAAPATAGELCADEVPASWAPPVSPPVVQLVVVLAAAGTAPVAAGALGLVLAGAGEPGTGVVCRWPRVAGAPVGDEPTLLSAPGARRLARALGARELPATARGRLAHVALPPDPAAAAAAAGRVAALDAPVVLALVGARPAAFDDLLARADRVVVATPPDVSPALLQLALADAARVGRATGHLVVPPAPTRAAAAAGLALTPALRRATEMALGGP